MSAMAVCGQHYGIEVGVDNEQSLKGSSSIISGSYIPRSDVQTRVPIQNTASGMNEKQVGLISKRRLACRKSIRLRRDVVIPVEGGRHISRRRPCRFERGLRPVVTDRNVECSPSLKTTSYFPYIFPYAFHIMSMAAQVIRRAQLYGT